MKMKINELTFSNQFALKDQQKELEIILKKISQLNNEAADFLMEISNLKQVVSTLELEKETLKKQKNEAENKLIYFQEENKEYFNKREKIKEDQSEMILFQRRVYQVFEKQKKKMEQVRETIQENTEMIKNLEIQNKGLENEVNLKNLKINELEKAYQKLNNTKMVKLTRKYWGFNKKMRGTVVDEKRKYRN
ncbi:hypothetical protein [Carnobacterium maltaromaticum]|uniref:hypothetical protein n=1 Tax=Carnobacterium maltaromaticum TaxID=2751 RepID=UPI0039BDD3C5